MKRTRVLTTAATAVLATNPPTLVYVNQVNYDVAFVFGWRSTFALKHVTISLLWMLAMIPAT